MPTPEEMREHQIEEAVEKTVHEVRALVMCAEINLENLAKLVPGLDQNPMYKIVKFQLRCAYSDRDPETIEEAQRRWGRQ